MIDYHTHTWRCGHAEGNIEDYVLKAIERGLTEIGISDHYPMDVLNVPSEDISSMLYQDLQTYVNEVKEVARRYESQITVRLGTEMDYFRDLKLGYNRILEEYDWDYVIGSIHFLEGKDVSHPKNLTFYQKNSLIDIYCKYFDEIKTMTNSEEFDIIGHVDVIKKHGYVPEGENSVKELQEFYLELARLFAQKQQVVEINTGGLRAPVEEIYPAEDFLNKLISHNVPLTIGSDAHHPDEVGYSNSEIVGYLKEMGVNTVVGFKNRQAYEVPL
ncbi:histidinol-phosphatase [Natranaerobius thermophilus]|uniref:histidinol-phosphatase n=1 Tax=Natranaerobius thermophilus TaxID=375929 RepID=UPI0002F07AF8|nr:histidinol-phosphatase [Natranaerobius thermophilus]